MKINMGPADRIIRILMAVLIIALYFTNVIQGTTAIILLVLATVFILTGFVSICPLYLPFGISTVKEKKQKQAQ
jgi:hypothetical protein